MRRLFVKATAAQVGENGSSLLRTELGESITLQDLIELYKKQGSAMNENLVAFYTIELLRMCETLQMTGQTNA